MFAAIQPCKAPHVSYIQPAALDDVLFEQLEFLLDHHNSDCADTCHHCARLAQVRQVLLSPFRG